MATYSEFAHHIKTMDDGLFEEHRAGLGRDHALKGQVSDDPGRLEVQPVASAT